MLLGSIATLFTIYFYFCHVLHDIRFCMRMYWAWFAAVLQISSIQGVLCNLCFYLVGCSRSLLFGPLSRKRSYFKVFMIDIHDLLRGAIVHLLRKLLFTDCLSRHSPSDTLIGGRDLRRAEIMLYFQPKSHFENLRFGLPLLGFLLCVAVEKTHCIDQQVHNRVAN